MRTIKQILLLTAIIGSLFFLYFKNSNSLARNLKKIPQDERKCLELFFRTAFAHDGLGYTLFGDKPITAVVFLDLAALRNENMYDYTFCALCPENLRMTKGYDILEKYKHLFSSRAIAVHHSKNFVDNEFTCVLFINKKLFLKTVANHLDDFKAILGNEITPELLLERVLNSDDVFGDVLKSHQGLIGTLLGYGRDNAWLFHQREEGYSLKGMSPLLAKKPFSLKRTSRILSEEELDAFEQRLQLFDERGILDFNPLLMQLPSFAADSNTAETKQLKIKYQRQYRDIIHRYKNKDFLETTLLQMSSDL